MYSREMFDTKLSRIGQTRARYLPSVVSTLRLVAFPFLVFSLNTGQLFLAGFLYVIVIASDLADGYLARKLHASSKFGANLDATVDFLFISGMFMYFVTQGVYPAWILMPIIFMFGQFIVTSLVSKIFYDPLGKYYGSFLYGTIGLTMFTLGPLIQSIIIVSLIGITIISLTTRLVYLTKKSIDNKAIQKNSVLLNNVTIEQSNVVT